MADRYETYRKKRLISAGISIAVLLVVLIAALLFGVDGKKREKTASADEAVSVQATQAPENVPDGAVIRNEGEAWFPEEKNWVYHFTYAYPYCWSIFSLVTEIFVTYLFPIFNLKCYEFC